ncbi:MAG: DUF5343 domain-containing protein [Nocardioidaceae bacterium]|nr:DUF5343 domain-containing protein [Nocardioidaceae bacterium]MCL2612183.1 DUF5343 domain-containing protein [Nocardioidaceae bacterium]
MPNYPYISGQGALIAAFTQLRKNVPPKVDASYLQRFNIAPANESYVISVLRFIGLINEDGDRVEDNTGFLYGNDESFKEGMEAALRSSYVDLFSDMGDDALDADKSALAHWFRSSDKTSELVGNRQASTFLTLAALAGHGEIPARATTTKKTTTKGAAPTKKTAAKKSVAKKVTETSVEDARSDGDGSRGGQGKVKVSNGQEVGLSVRIDVNLPPGGDAETYDAIFASIKKHLMS